MSLPLRHETGGDKLESQINALSIRMAVNFQEGGEMFSDVSPVQSSSALGSGYLELNLAV